MKTASASRSAADAKTVRDYFLAANAPAELKAARDNIAATQKELDAFRMSLPRVMIMSDARPRKTHVLQRGNYEMPGEEVTARHARQPVAPACRCAQKPAWAWRNGWSARTIRSRLAFR